MKVITKKDFENQYAVYEEIENKIAKLKNLIEHWQNKKSIAEENLNEYIEKKGKRQEGTKKTTFIEFGQFNFCCEERENLKVLNKKGAEKFLRDNKIQAFKQPPEKIDHDEVRQFYNDKVISKEDFDKYFEVKITKIFKKKIAKKNGRKK